MDEAIGKVPGPFYVVFENSTSLLLASRNTSHMEGIPENRRMICLPVLITLPATPIRIHRSDFIRRVLNPGGSAFLFITESTL